MAKVAAKAKVRPTMRSVRRVDGFCKALGIGRSKFYSFPPEDRPKTAKLGSARVILESPEEFLARLAAKQEMA